MASSAQPATMTASPFRVAPDFRAAQNSPGPLVQCVECRRAIARCSHQEPPPLGLHQGQRLLGRQGDAFKQRQAAADFAPRGRSAF